MTFSQLVERALQRVERRGEITLPTSAMARELVQSFCAEHRWHWRKRQFTFTTTSGTSTYDLSSITTVPASAGKDFEEMIDLFYQYSTTDVRRLDPVFDEWSYAASIADTTTAEPGAYFIDANASQIVRLSPVPGGTYTMRAVCWGIPYFDADDSTDTIPLVPVRLHRVLVIGLAAEFAAIGYGMQDPRTVALSQKYQNETAKEFAKDSGSVQKVREMKDNCAATYGDAVRSTR